jgi:superfamily II DNA/RNA helicase
MNKFEEMGLPKEIIATLSEMKFSEPTPIKKRQFHMQ